MRPFLFLMAAGALGTAPCVHFLLPAASAQVLNLETAQAVALAQHPELRAAGLEREAAEGATAQARAWPNPELSALVEDTRQATRVTTLQLNQPIEMGGKRAARIKAAQILRSQADVDLAARQAQIIAQVAGAFHGVAVAQERIRLTEELGRLSSQAREAASKRVLAGKVSPVEELKAQVAEAHALSAVSTAQSEWQAALAQLRQALGDSAITFDRV